MKRGTDRRILISNLSFGDMNIDNTSHFQMSAFLKLKKEKKWKYIWECEKWDISTIAHQLFRRISVINCVNKNSPQERNASQKSLGILWRLEIEFWPEKRNKLYRIATPSLSLFLSFEHFYARWSNWKQQLAQNLETRAETGKVRNWILFFANFWIVVVVGSHNLDRIEGKRGCEKIVLLAARESCFLLICFDFVSVFSLQMHNLREKTGRFFSGFFLPSSILTNISETWRRQIFREKCGKTKHI